MNVLFVCTGNTCRSPMAEGIFKKIATEKNLKNINVSSAGIAADNSSGATENAVKVCQEWNVDLKLKEEHITYMNYDTVDVFRIDPKKKYSDNRRSWFHWFKPGDGTDSQRGADDNRRIG